MIAGRRRWVPLLVGVVVMAVALGAVACGGDEELEAELSGVDMTGTATITEDGDGVEVVVEVKGLPAGMHANHVHHGSCTNQGAVHVPLTELDADAGGDAEATTKWTENDIDHFKAGHYVAAHEMSTADGIGAVIVCGNVS